MAANLTPQYLDAEAEYKKAQTAEERLACLRKMYALLPKHKASEKLQAELKTKISAARDDAEQEQHKARKGGVSYKIPRQGAGQYALVGAPNVGKSRPDSPGRATPEVAPYPFTTREPSAGMMDWEDVKVQLIDLPPITPDVMEGQRLQHGPGRRCNADARRFGGRRRSIRRRGRVGKVGGHQDRAGRRAASRDRGLLGRIRPHISGGQ